MHTCAQFNQNLTETNDSASSIRRQGFEINNG